MITHLIVGFVVFAVLFVGLGGYVGRKYDLDGKIAERFDRFEQSRVVMYLALLVLALVATLAHAVNLLA